MTTEQIIIELQKYPPHFEVQALLIRPELGDQTAEFVGIIPQDVGKIVYLELATPLLKE